MTNLSANKSHGSVNSVTEDTKMNKEWFWKFYDYEYGLLTGNKCLNYPSRTNQLTWAELNLYYSSPWIFTQWFYQTIDKTAKGSISYNDYISAFDSWNTFNIDKKIKFIFDLFNINKDKYVHYEDIKMILNYSYIYLKCSDIKELNNWIDLFFKQRKNLSFKRFNQKIYKSNSDVLVLWLFLFYKYRRYNFEILECLKSQDNKCNVSNSGEINIGNMNPDNIILVWYNLLVDFGIKIYRPSIRLYRFLINNFKIDVYTINNIQIDGNSYPSSTNLPSPYDNGCNPFNCSIQSVKSNDCNANVINNNSFWEGIIDPEEDKEWEELSSFEHDFTNMRMNLYRQLNANDNVEKGINNNNNNNVLKNGQSNKTNTINSCTMGKHLVDNGKFIIPRGSDDVIMKSGVMEYSLMSKQNNHNNNSNWNTSFSSNNSFWPSSIGRSKGNNDSSDNIMPKNFMKRRSDNFTLGFMNKIQNLAANTNTVAPTSHSKHRPSGSLSMFCVKLNSIPTQNHWESLPSQMENPICKVVDIKETNKIFLKAKNEEIRQYYYKMISGYILIFSMKKDKLQMIVPLRNWFIESITDAIPLSSMESSNNQNDWSKPSATKEENYYSLNLCNTSWYKTLKYTILFKSKDSWNKLSNKICKETKYKTWNENFEKKKNIGKGTYGSIYWMQEKKSGIIYAVKKIEKTVKTKEEFDSLFWEEDISRFLINYNFILNEGSDVDPAFNSIIKIFDVFETWEHIYFIMENISRGSLGHIWRSQTDPFSFEDIKDIAKQIIDGVGFWNSYGIIHRDWKLENLLLSKENEIKIIDFGLAQVITPLSKTKEAFGTWLYSAPEIWINSFYDFRVDVWSYGVILYYWLFNIMPFSIKGNESQQVIANKIVNSSLEIYNIGGSGISLNEDGIFVRTLITMCLVKNIEKRVSLERILEFFKNGEI